VQACGIGTHVLRRWRSDLWYGDRSWKDGSGEGETTGWLAEMGRFVVAGIMKGHDDGV
jgi:hypothetical protein